MARHVLSSSSASTLSLSPLLVVFEASDAFDDRKKKKIVIDVEA